MGREHGRAGPPKQVPSHQPSPGAAFGVGPRQVRSVQGGPRRNCYDTSGPVSDCTPRKVFCAWVCVHWPHCTSHLVLMCSSSHLLTSCPAPSPWCISPSEAQVPAGCKPGVSWSAAMPIPICFNLKESGFLQGDPCQEFLNWNCCEFGVAFQILVLQLLNVTVSKSCCQGCLLSCIADNKTGWKIFWLKDAEKCKSVAIIFGFEWAENRRVNFAFKEHWEIIASMEATFSLSCYDLSNRNTIVFVCRLILVM